MSTWRTYDAATAEDRFLEPLYICVECGTRLDEAFDACPRCDNKEAEKFVFPSKVPMEFFLEFIALGEKHGDKIPITELVPLLPKLFGGKRYERLKRVCNGEQLAAIQDDLLREYGFAEAEGEEVPLENRKAQRASAKQSSKTGERSKQTSTASTKSKTSTNGARQKRGAGSSTASKR